MAESTFGWLGAACCFRNFPGPRKTSAIVCGVAVRYFTIYEYHHKHSLLIFDAPGTYCWSSFTSSKVSSSLKNIIWDEPSN